MPRALAVILVSCALATHAAAQGPFARFTLPADWQTRFWDDPRTAAIVAMEPKAVAALVPVQSGLKWCRCPGCGADDRDDPLEWTPAKPEIITCRVCNAAFPNDQVPAKVPPSPGLPPAIPDDVVEVVPRVFHHYLYHIVEPERQRWPDERIYLAAKRDALVRAFLSKFALYAAIRHREQPPDSPDSALGRLASTIVLRFAQVYPRYAAHLDLPGQAKVLHPTTVGPPFRPGYLTARWDDRACHEVPIDLAIAYALLRESPAFHEAARQLDIGDPERLVEQDLLYASARFLRAQPHDATEAGLTACRGLLVAGRLLNDPDLVTAAAQSLDRIAEQAFYHDGTWKTGNLDARRRVDGLVNGWIAPLLEGTLAASKTELPPGAKFLSIAALRQPREDSATAAIGVDRFVRATAFNGDNGLGATDPSGFDGGFGSTRLTTTIAENIPFAVELGDTGRGLPECFQRLGLTISLAGRRVLGGPDPSDAPGRGWSLATASGNVVLVNGLNQRESLDALHQPAPPSDVRFFAAQPDIQVACLHDRAAYPTSTTLYKHIAILISGRSATYAVSFFEVEGGQQHDQVFNAASDLHASWQTALPLTPESGRLLPASIPFLPNARADDGRWFIQALGEFRDLRSAHLDSPTQAALTDGKLPGVRFHLLSDAPSTLYTARVEESIPNHSHSALVLRRRSDDGSPLTTRFVNLIEPLLPNQPPALRRVGRIDSNPDCVVLAIETSGGIEFLVINSLPNSAQTIALDASNTLRTDALVVHVTPQSLVQAGGTFSELNHLRATAPAQWGTLIATDRQQTRNSRGAFVTESPIESPETAVGKALIVRHGDGSSHAWTVTNITSADHTPTRIAVKEEPGFTIDPATGDAVYYQQPLTRTPGPHVFRICSISRSPAAGDGTVAGETAVAR